MWNAYKKILWNENPRQLLLAIHGLALRLFVAAKFAVPNKQNYKKITWVEKKSAKNSKI